MKPSAGPDLLSRFLHQVRKGFLAGSDLGMRPHDVLSAKLNGIWKDLEPAVRLKMYRAGTNRIGGTRLPILLPPGYRRPKAAFQQV